MERYGFDEHVKAALDSSVVPIGAYLACNQAFAEYANRKTPAEAVGLDADMEMTHSCFTVRIRMTMNNC